MISVTERNKMIGKFIGSTDYTPATTLYMAVSTSALNDSGSGFTEPTPESGYVRTAIANNTTKWNLPVEGLVTNKEAITMAELNRDCGIATHYFFMTTPTGGTNAIIWGKFDEPRPMPSFSTIYVPIGEAKFSLLDAVVVTP